MAYDFWNRTNAMKEHRLVELRTQLREVAKFLTGVEVSCSDGESFDESAEAELATDVEYAIDRLKAVANYLRSRQEDRESENKEGDEWKE